MSSLNPDLTFFIKFTCSRVSLVPPSSFELVHLNYSNMIKKIFIGKLPSLYVVFEEVQYSQKDVTIKTYKTVGTKILIL